MDEKLYRELGQLTKEKTLWKQNIPYVASLLENQSPKITAKAMWLLGEMGLIYPQEIAPYTKEIATFIVSENDLLRERTANALGRIGRADYQLVAPYFKELFILAEDKSPWFSPRSCSRAPAHDPDTRRFHSHRRMWARRAPSRRNRRYCGLHLFSG